MKLRERVSGLLSHLKGSNEARKQRKHRHLRSLLVEQLEGRRLLAVVDLLTIGSQGTIFYGANIGDASGISVSSAGDVNGDGYDDMIIGALQADADADGAGIGLPKSNAGESYVVFGAATLPATINLDTMALSVGFKIFGSDIDDFSGSSVSGVGDVNGDGLDDLIVGASFGDALANAKSYAGEAYLIFGAPTFASNIDLFASLGSAGMKIYGADTFDQAGFSVSNAGDVNGDGFNDLAIGANFAAAAGNAKLGAGESYVIFGSGTLPGSIDLSALGSAGITIYGADVDDQSGYSISGAGDVNGDGFDDLIVGAVGGDASANAKSFAGDSYIIFGSIALPSTIDLAVLGTAAGSAGVTIFGTDISDESGFSVSSAGDVNGDGFDDVIVGARYGDALANAKTNAGESYVIYGAASLPATIDLASLGSAGIIIYGLDAGDQSGFSVSGAGDVDADGYDDLIIGALKANTNGNTRATAGESYIVFGGPSLTSPIDVASAGIAGVAGIDGVTIYGFGVGDESGTSVSAAGDVNGDGFDDVIIGAFAADAAGNAKAGAGESYVVFGTNSFTNSITVGNLGAPGIVNDAINGTAGAELINGANGDDTLVGAGGADVLTGGRGNDIIAVSNLSFNRIVGGNGSDTLRLDGIGLTLDLETLADNRILGIETIDISGNVSGSNTLMLNRLSALNISDESNLLTVIGGSDDRVSTIGWTFSSNSGGFNFYTQGNATLKVSDVVPVQFTLDLATLPASRGSIISGAVTGDFSGISVSSAGDVNGDGFEDVIIGAYSLGTSYNGESYVIFGKATPLSTIDLLSVAPDITILGADASDRSGFSVSSAGDFNGDGIGDLLIGAPYANSVTNSRSDAGESYIIYGKSNWILPATINLFSTSADVTIYGAADNDNAGVSVSTAGDVNGDGFDDVIVGAPGASSGLGKSYIVYGSNLASGATVDLLTAGSITMISGAAAGDSNGTSVSNAGDVNNDGFDDLIVSSPSASANLGRSYVIFGSTPISSTTAINLATYNSALTIVGATAGDRTGTSISAAGDVDGDGNADLIVASNAAGSSAGKTYLVFGKSTWTLPLTIDLATFTSTEGITISGIDTNDFSGISVSGAGDVNGDGYDDLIIGANKANAAGNSKADAGESYLVFGKPTGWVSFSLSTLGTPGNAIGLTIFGADAGDQSGRSVSGAGDVNGDGYDDLIIGSPYSMSVSNGRSNAGETYVLYGRNFNDSVTHQGTAAAEIVAGTAAADKIVGGRGNDTLAGNGGSDVIIGGQGDDVISVTSASFSRVDGGTGNDTLQLVGSGLTLDLTTLSNAKLFDIETIDITGSGNNTLTLDLDEVLNLSPTLNTLAVPNTPNTLIVRRNAGDVVNRGAGWTQGSIQTIGLDSFSTFTQGAATLLIQLASPIVVITSGNKVYDKLVYVATASVTGADSPSPTLSFTYYSDAGGVTTISAPTNAGTYYVRAFTAANANNLAAQSGISQFVISQKVLTATFTNGGATKVYTSSTAASVANANITLIGVVSGDTVTATATGTFDTKNIGTGKSVVIDTVVLAGASNLNYTITTGGTLTSNITARGLTATGTATKVYDGNTVAPIVISLSGVQAPDTITGSASGTYNNANVGTGKTLTIGTVTLTGTELANYTFGGTATGTGTITAKALTATASVDTKVYNASTAVTISYSGLSGFIGIETVTATGTGTFIDKNVANGKTVTAIAPILANGTNGGMAANYSLATPTGLTGDITIATISAITGITANNKVYDANTSATLVTGGASFTGKFAGDTLTVASSTGNFVDKNVANGKIVNIIGLTLGGGDAGNYSLASSTASTNADITVATISAIAGITANNKAYDATTAATLVTGSASFTGKFAGDTLTVASSTGNFVNKNVANGKIVNITGLTLGGGDAGNYSLASSTASTNADITVATISAITGITANNKAYDATTAATMVTGSASFTGKFAGDTLTVASSTGNFVNKNVANGKIVNITGLTLGGGDAGNYSLASSTASTNADITVATISAITGITANNKAYDATTAATLVTGSASFTGKFAGDTLTVASSTGNFVNKNVASGKIVNITGLTLGGGDAGNYTLASSTASTNADITVATISAIAGITANNKAYDATNAATLVTSGASFTGKFAGDTLTVASSTGNFVDANVGTGKIVNITGLILGGADLANYTLASNSASTTANISAAVINRRVFYNGATLNGVTTVAGATGFGASSTVGASFAATVGNPPATAIDSSKVAILPSGSSTFGVLQLDGRTSLGGNYTNTSFGLNGIIVDMGIPVGNTLTIADFSFATGETLALPGFTTLVGAALNAVDPQVTQYAAGGIDGSTRAKLTFDNNSLRNIWFKVTVLANANTGLAADSVFYFGNVVGDVNGSTTTSGGSTRYTVNAIDTSGVRNKQSTPSNSVLVTDIFDFNKTGNVNALDTSVVRTNQQASGIVRVIALAPSFLAFGEGDGMAPTIQSSMGISASNSEEAVAQPLTLNSNSQSGSPFPTVSQQPKASQITLDAVVKSGNPSRDAGNTASFDAFFAALGSN